MEGKEKINIELFGKQKEAFDCVKKFVACIAGVQSGKTMGGACWVQKQLAQEKGDGVIIANDYKMLDQSTLPKLFEVNPGLKKFYKQQRGLIELPDKTRIYIRSAENPQAIEGFTAAWAWLDEAGKYKLDVWVNIQARLAIKQGQVFITTTPDSMNWLFHDFYDRFLKGDEDFAVFQWKSIENPYFSEEEYERARKTLSPATFRRRYEGTFEQMEGLVYQLRPEQIIEPIELHSKDTIAGVDFGWTNPSAVSVIKFDKEGLFYIVDEVYEEQMTTDELIEKCIHLQKRYNITKFYPDSAEPDRIEEMRRKGLYTREIKKDILAGVSEVQNLIHQNRLKVFKNCKHTIEEFSTYHYETPQQDKNQKEKPLPFNDHLMDAIRYAITSFSYVAEKPRHYSYRPLNKRTGY